MPRNFFDDCCCDGDGEDVLSGCVAPDSLKIPNRTAPPAIGPCSGAGSINFDTVDNALELVFNATSGPIFRVPPASGVPAPVPVQVSDDGANPPTLSPLGTASSTPFPDLGDSRWVVGLPNSALMPSLSNSVFHFEPGMSGVLATTLTVTPLSGGVASTTFLLDMPNAASTTTIDIRNSLAGVAALTMDGLLRIGQSGGVARLDTTSGALLITTPGGAAANDIIMAPGGGEVRPDLNDSYDLGTSAIRWRTIYLASTNPAVDIANAGGTSFLRLDFNGASGRIVTTAVTSPILLDPGNGVVNVDGRLDPSTDGASGTPRDLGNNVTPLRWRDGWFTGTLNAGAVSVTSATITTLTVTTIRTPALTDLLIDPGGGNVTKVASDLLPNADATFALGSGPLRWTSLSLSSGIVGLSSLSVNMSNAAATTLSITNSGGGSVAHLTVSGGISATLGAVAPTTGVIHASTLRGGDGTNYGEIITSGSRARFTAAASTGIDIVSLVAASGGADIGVILDANNLATATADKIISFRTANTERAYVRADGAVFAAISGGTNASLQIVLGVPAFVSSSGFIGIASNSGGGGGTCLILDSTSITGTLGCSNAATLCSATVANVGLLLSNGGINVATPTVTGGVLQNGGTILITNGSAIQNVTTVTGSGNFNTTGGAIQTNSATRITNAGVTENLDMDGQATGCKIRLKVASSVANNREIVVDESTIPPTLIYQDSGGAEHTLQFAT